MLVKSLSHSLEESLLVRLLKLFSHSKTLAVVACLPSNAAGKTYILQAKGNSLNSELISDADYLIVEARQDAKRGATLSPQYETVVRR